MDKSSRLDIPIEEQRQGWNRWNSSTAREKLLDQRTLRQAQMISQWISDIGRRDLEVLECGCGTGWLSERLIPFGHVTGVDLADEVIGDAQRRVPAATFIAGDFMAIPLGSECFDVIVCFETLSHFADQPALVARFAELLKPGGMLLIATQNRPILEKCRHIGPPMPGHIRRWVDSRKLVELLESEFELDILTSVSPDGNVGWLRVVNAKLVNRALDGLSGGRYTHFKERKLLGFTLMSKASRLSRH